MRRLVLIFTAFLAAGGIAAVPAIVGIAGNPSFSHQIPVRVPTHARPVHLVDDAAGAARSSPEAVPSTHGTADMNHTRRVEPRQDSSARTGEVEVGDDRSRRGNRDGADDGRRGDSSSGGGRDDRGRDDSSHKNHGR